jgi:hypothetical protein
MKITIGEFFDLVEKNGGTYTIKTPSGFKPIGNLFKKLNKDCIKITLKNGKVLEGSETHLVEVDKHSLNPLTKYDNGSYWLSLGTITEGELVWCENNELSEVVSYEEIGIHNTHDLEVLDTENKYISNGIVSHNCGKTAIAEGLAWRIVQKEVPEVIADAVIEPLTLNEPVTNTSPFAE